jgi:hypothetical protein
MVDEFREEIAKFLIYHENHLDFYKCVWQKAQMLEACSSILKNSITHLIEGSKVDNELATVVSIVEKLKGISGNILASSALENFKGFNQRFQLPFDDPMDNQLFVEFFNVLRHEEELFQYVFNVSAMIQKALSLVEMMDISQPAVSADLLDKKQIERFLLVSSEVIGEAAVKARVGAELFQTNEKMWCELVERARQLGIQVSEVKEEKTVGHSENRQKIEEIFRILAEWAQENFARLLYKFEGGITDFKFVRVSEISKFWNENALSYVYAVLEYEYKGTQKRYVSFQIDDNGKIVGWNLFEPIKG